MLLENEKKMEIELIKALQEVEQSGFIDHFDPFVHLKGLHNKHS